MCATGLVSVAELWRWLINGQASGAHNMAVDEALLDAMQRPGARPVLRLYAWRPAALSLGYFQSINSVDLAACLEAGVDVVRRPTGGRAVLHDNEVTYAIVLPAQHPLARMGVVESYRALSAGLVRGLELLHVTAELSRSAPNHGEATPMNPGLQAACFDAASWYELMVAGRKMVGSAQVRRHGALLQHGSIPLTLDASKLYRLFCFSSDAARVQAEKRFAVRAAGLAEVVGGAKAIGQADVNGNSLSWDAVAAAISRGVQEVLDCELLADSLTKQEEALVELLECKHRSAAWVQEKRVADKHAAAQ